MVASNVAAGMPALIEKCILKKVNAPTAALMKKLQGSDAATQARAKGYWERVVTDAPISQKVSAAMIKKLTSAEHAALLRAQAKQSEAEKLAVEAKTGLTKVQGLSSAHWAEVAKAKAAEAKARLEAAKRLKEAASSVVQLTMAGSIADYTASVLEKIKADVAKAAKCKEQDVTLKVSAGSVIITATLPKLGAQSLVDQVTSDELKAVGGVAVATAKCLRGCSVSSTEDPTVATRGPSNEPTTTPTEVPSLSPTPVPTEVPTTLPPTTGGPSFSPTRTPTEVPSAEPTITPTEQPTPAPTPVPKLETLEFKESPMMMPLPGNLGVVAVHGMEMDPAGEVPSIKVSGQWNFPGLFVANVSMATLGKEKVVVNGKFDLSHCTSHACRIFAALANSPFVIFEGTVNGIQLPMLPSSQPKKDVPATKKSAMPTVTVIITLPGLNLKLPMMVGPCKSLAQKNLFFAQAEDDICIDLSKTAYSLSSAVGSLISSAKPMAMQLSQLGPIVGLDINQIKLPSFFGTISKARIFSAIMRLDKSMKFKGVRVGIKVGTWTHVVTADFDCEALKGASDIYNLLEFTPGKACFSLSASSAAEFGASSLLGASGVLVDTKVGGAAKVMAGLTLDKPSIAIIGSTADFAGTLSGRVKFGNLTMEASLTIAGLPKTMKGAVKIALTSKSAINDVLVTMGVNVDAAIPDLKIGNIQLYASSGTLNLNRYHGLEVMTGLPNNVGRGLMLNADLNFAAGCKSIACKVMTALKLKNVRLQGGIKTTGLTLEVGTTVPKAAMSSRGFELPAWAEGRLMVPAPWPTIDRKLPLIWGPLSRPGESGGVDTKKICGFFFKTVLAGDKVVGMTNLDEMGLNFNTVATVMDIDPKNIKMPKFLTADLTKTAIKTFLVQLRASNIPAAAMLRVTLPDVTINVVVKSVKVAVGFKSMTVTAVTDGVVHLDGTMELAAGGSSAPIPFLVELNWRKGIQFKMRMKPDGKKLEQVAKTFLTESELDKKVSLPKLKSGLTMAQTLWRGTTTRFHCVPVEGGTRFQFKSCSLAVHVQPTMTLPFASFTNSTVLVTVLNPLSAQMKLGELKIYSKISVPALDVEFTTEAVFKADSDVMSADVSFKGLAVKDPNGIEGITATVTRIQVKLAKNSKGQREFSALADASVDISGFKVVKDIKNFLPKSLLNIKGQLGAIWIMGEKSAKFFLNIDLAASIPASWPITLDKFNLNFEAEKGQKPEDLVLTGSTVVKIKLGAAISFKVLINLPFKTKILALTTRPGGCQTIFASFKICNGGLTVLLDGNKKEITKFEYKGTFEFDASKFGPLKNVIAPMQKTEVYMGVKFNTARGKYMFRIGKHIKIGMAVSVFEVISSSVHFEIPLGSLHFTFGGEVIIKLKIGSAKSYPVLTVSMGYNLAIQRIELDGQMDGCWKNPFGLQGLQICDVIMGAGIGPAPPFVTRFAIGGAVTMGKHKFVFGARMDFAQPSMTGLICHYKGKLSISELIGIAVSMASKASGKSISTPNMGTPIFELTELKIKVSAGFFRVGGETFWPGFTFEAKFSLFGVNMRCRFNVGLNGILAEFSSERLALLGNTLMFCKNTACKREEGPQMKLEVKLIPPKFAVSFNGFANLFGLKFGAIVDVQWSLKHAFKANFTAYPITLGKGALKILASKHSKDKNVKGPSCILDSAKRLLTISGRVELFGFSTDGYVEATPTKFKAQLVHKLLGFYWKTFFSAGVMENGIPAAVTVGFEAGAPGGDDIRTKLRTLILDGLNKIKDAGMRAINAAKKKLTDAQAVFDRAARAVASKRTDVRNAQNKVNGICSGEELVAVDSQDFADLLKDTPSKPAARRLLAHKPTPKTTSVDHALAASVKQDTPADVAVNGQVEAKADLDAELFASDKWGGSRRRRWVHLHHRHRPHLHHRHRPHLHHRHRPHVHTAKMIKDAKDAAKRAADAAAKAARDAAAAAAKAAKDAACAALKVTAKAALKVVEGALHVAEQAVKLPARALDAAKLALTGVLKLNHAAYAIFKEVLKILPTISMFKFSITLMGAVIPAAFELHIKARMAGKDFEFRLKLGLNDLAKLVKPLIDKAVDWLKSKISIPSLGSFLGEEFLLDEEIVRRSNEEVEWIVNDLDTGDTETGPAVM
jgi:hypothetical protein